MKSCHLCVMVKDRRSQPTWYCRNTQTKGMLVLTANRPDMKLGANDHLVVNMEAAHKKSGLTVHYFSEIDRACDLPQGFWCTSRIGSLYGQSRELDLHSRRYYWSFNRWSFRLFGSLGARASENQDAPPRLRQLKEGWAGLWIIAALDSQVIYEGFSNFQISLRPQVSTQPCYCHKTPNFSRRESLPLNLLHNTCKKDGTFLDSIIEMATPSGPLRYCHEQQQIRFTQRPHGCSSCPSRWRYLSHCWLGSRSNLQSPGKSGNSLTYQQLRHTTSKCRNLQ